jgi:hypothetical protein
MFAWIDMLEDDSAAAAAQASSRFAAFPSAYHFHDPEREIGRAVAQSIGGVGKIAWDFYLLYARTAQWNQAPPAPVAWFHQLQEESWAGPDHFRWDQALEPAIRQALEDILRFRAA